MQGVNCSCVKCEQDTHRLSSMAITMCPMCMAGGAGLDRAPFIHRLCPFFECVCTYGWRYTCVGVTCGHVCLSKQRLEDMSQALSTF